MLHEFLTTNRAKILERARARVATRTAPRPTHEELTSGIPLFLDELIATLSRGDERSNTINRDAALHGESRQKSGFTVAQVVRDYGDLCQVVTQLAIELEAPIDTENFKTLNGCLDDAIAQAVTEFTRGRERSLSDDEIQRLGFLAHEMRNHLNAATLSYDILKKGIVGIGGNTGAVLGRSLTGLRELVDRTLAQVRLDAGIQHSERIEIASFLEEVEAGASIAAMERDLAFSIDRGPAGVIVEGDRQLLGSAVSNLLDNAIKFTHDRGNVRIGASATPERVEIQVEDQCGGLLQPAQLEGLFKEYQQSDRDKSGLGLGLAISKRAVESMGGVLRARNRAGVGCVFTIDLPRARTHSS